MARPIAKDHEEKRTQILNTAARVFAAEGVDRASMNRIAAACGISKANIYHYYAGKEALLFDLLETYLRVLRDRVCVAPEPGMTAEDRLLGFVRAVLQAYRGADDHHKIQISGLDALPAERQKVLRAYQRDMVVHLSAILRDAAPTQLSEDAPRLRATAMSVFGMLSWYYMWNGDAGQEARDDYARLVTSLTLRGICGAPDLSDQPDGRFRQG